VKLICVKKNHLIFELGEREKRLLFEVLKLYPLIPISHHQLTTKPASAETKADQKLLEEALAEQRKENKQQLEAMLNEESRFKKVRSGFHFSLSPQQAEWLLQVLNDVRVGSWLFLGQPDEKKGKTIDLNPENAHYLWALELCGYFQSMILHALQGGR
jgi:hypothetical protein